MQIRRAFWVFLGVLVFAITGYALTGARVYSRLASLAGLLIAASYIWTRLGLQGITLRRSARFLRQQVGQVFEERFEVNNSFWLSKLWIEVHDQSNLPRRTGSKVLTWIGPKQRRSYVAYTRLTDRGQFVLGPTLLRAGDPFGLFFQEQVIPSEKSLLVLPYMVELSGSPLPPGFLPGGRALRRKTLEVTPYAAGVREYAPGDALNRIHWPTVARRDRLMVKEFDQDPQADIWFLVDADRRAQLVQADRGETEEKIDRHWLWRSQYKFQLPANTFEYAVTIAASMAGFYIRAGRAVGLACAGQAFTVLPVERGERQLGKILEMLAYIRGEGELPLMGLVEAQAPHLARGSTVVMITPSVDRTVEAAVDELLHRDLLPVMVMIDRVSFNGYGSLDTVTTRLKARRVPVAVVERGADLRQALESDF